MPGFEVVLVLLVIVAVVATVARRVDVAFPILLVVAGVGIGLLPGLADVQLDPQVVLVVFLPPLVFAAAWQTPLRDVRENVGPVLLLSVGLVLFTTVVVGVVASSLVPGITLAAGLAFGALISPTDPLAATTVLERLEVPRRIRAILEEESLVNDATALTAYRTAVVAALSGSFVIADATLAFVVAVVGGVLVGLVVAILAGALWSRLFDPPVEVTLSLVLPYAAYLPAEHLGASGVVAAVTAGLVLGFRSARILASDTRLLAGSVWDIVVFLLNGFAFLLVGLELPALLAGLADQPLARVAGAAVAVAAAVVVSRFVWVFGSLLVGPAWSRLRHPDARIPPPAVPLVVSWAGMRGAVSLAAALALPGDFPQRDLLLFLTFVVIAATLLGQGLTFPWLLRRVRLPHGTDDLEEETLARTQAAEAALHELGRLRERWPGHVPLIENIEQRIRHRLEHLPEEDGGGGLSLDPTRDQERTEHLEIANAVIGAERETVIGLRDRGEISDVILRRVERELDLEELRLEADL